MSRALSGTWQCLEDLVELALGGFLLAGLSVLDDKNRG
jgi:hypothetical protein